MYNHIELGNNWPLLAFVGGILCFLLCLFLIFREYRKYQLRSQAECLLKKTQVISASLESFTKRLELIEPHAVNYMNTLGAEGSKTLYDLRKRLAAISSVLLQIDQLIECQSLEALQTAEQLYEYSFNFKDHETDESYLRKVAEGKGSLFKIKVPKNWELQIESQIQHFGREVYEASLLAAKSGLPKSKRKRPTLTSLNMAKIKLQDSKV